MNKGGEFPINPYFLDRYSSLTIRNPMFVGDFSLDKDRILHTDKRNLKFIHLNYDQKEVYFNLNQSIEKSVKKHPYISQEEKLDKLLKWISLNKYKFLTQEDENKRLKSLSTDFVCFRGLLTELLCTPYEFQEGWIILATRFRNTIYLLAILTPEKEERRKNETPREKLMSSWGYKFEQYMTGENTDEGVNENEEYCCVLRSRLVDHSLVYGAEVDCAVKPLYHSPHSSLNAFVELKTSKEVIQQRDVNSLHRFKMRKWWAQSYLVGIPRLICGFRNEGGIVKYLKVFEISDLPGLCKEHWSKDSMMHFLNDFLAWLKRMVVIDDPKHVYKIVRLPRENKISCYDLGSDSGMEFLPRSYVEEIFS